MTTFTPEAIFKKAVEQGGLRFRLPSKNKAISFRHQLYAWRKKHHNKLRIEAEGRGLAPSEPFAYVILSIRDPEDRKVTSKSPNLPGAYDIVFQMGFEGEIIGEDKEAEEVEELDEAVPDISELVSGLSLDIGD